jgi:hypothetical protein
MNSTTVANGWSLEVVRGKEVGRTFALNGGASVLGNAPGGGPSIDLSGQEAGSARRMAARQAELECSSEGLLLRDLDSPGGTFVNRQRILPGQARPLQPGDVIQLGGVQLKVVTGARPPASSPPPMAPVSAPKPGPLPAPYTLATGATCRTWDDFLTVAAQRWTAMRDELTSGRLAAFLVAQRRPDLAPSPHTPGTPDERLDAWLGGLPATRQAGPELDVHPPALNVRAVPGGGVTRQTVRVTNTGVRLLRSTVRVEPQDASWLRVGAEFARAPFVTVEQTEVPLEVEIPETLDRLMRAALVVEGNGGTRRVEVRVERPAAPTEVPEAVPPTAAGPGLRAAVARWPVGVRVFGAALAGLLLRLLVAVGGALFGGAMSAEEAAPPLRGALVMAALAGGVGAAWLARRRGEPGDIAPAAFAGAVAGALGATVLVAACRTVEPLLGSLPSSPVAACLLWAVLGAALAGTSAWLIPYQPTTESQR